MVNDVPLKFYHFSGFDSGAQESMLGVYANGNKYLYELREWYIKRMQEEEQDKYGKFASKYNFYDNGEKITNEERKVMRKRIDVSKFFEDTNPYTVEQEKSYYKWYRKEIGLEFENKSLEQLREENQIMRNELDRIYSMKYWKFGKKVKSAMRKIGIK